MSKILIVAEYSDQQIKKSTLELVSYAASTGNEVHVALLGSKGPSHAEQLGKFGAKGIFTCTDPILDLYSAEAYGIALLKICEKLSPKYILASHSAHGRDFMPRLAGLLNTGLVSDCISVDLTGDKPKVKRPMYAGKAIAHVELLGTDPKLLTVRPNTFPKPAPASQASTPAVENISVDFSSLKSKTLRIEAGQSKRLDVTEASTVISGGRSLKSAENFSILESLADTLGAAVGASRAAVDAGYRPHRDQVGQTGKVVSPSLYIACGISGAIQHLAGMRTSKTIVAINTDPDAPIFQLADYGVVGDLFTLVPLIEQEIKKIK